MIRGQIDLTEYINSTKELAPQFSVGDTVYIRSLDVILRCKIGRVWLCGERSENPYFGYSVDFEDGGHDTFWDYSIGDKVFFDEKSARNKAECLHFEKLDPRNLDLEGCKSFEHIRRGDGYRLTATVAKVGETQLYEHSFMCYHFLREYQNKGKRDAAYEKLLKDITENADDYGKTELIPPALDTLYRVTDTLYASRGYAEHNGVRGTQ